MFLDSNLDQKGKKRNYWDSQQNWNEGGAWDHDLSQSRLMSHPGTPQKRFFPLGKDYVVERGRLLLSLLDCTLNFAYYVYQGLIIPEKLEKENRCLS